MRLSKKTLIGAGILVGLGALAVTVYAQNPLLPLEPPAPGSRTLPSPDSAWDDASARVLRFSALIYKYAAEFNISPALLSAHIHQESQGRECALNPNGEYSVGLFQINCPNPYLCCPYSCEVPGHYWGLNVGKCADGSGLYDPETNIRAGAGFVSWLTARYCDGGPCDAAISKYSTGPNSDYVNTPYINSVNSLYAQYRTVWGS